MDGDEASGGRCVAEVVRSHSPLEEFLRAFDRLDADACAALFAADGRLRYVDGRVEEGAHAVADLHSTEHVLREQWHLEGVWIAEVEARYVLADHSILGPVSKVFVIRMSQEGIADLRVYAAGEPGFHETSLRHERERHRGILVGGRRLPPL
jgi:hypothetical protein